MHVAGLVNAFDDVAGPEWRLKPVAAEPGEVRPRSHAGVAHQGFVADRLVERGPQPVAERAGCGRRRRDVAEHMCGV
ncbi:MAG: hypothetical protein M5U18_08505 [Dehalococcoidia bacterium]|nr:hypothetical protein [Dehalococcoidia bacterium]